MLINCPNSQKFDESEIRSNWNIAQMHSSSLFDVIYVVIICLNSHEEFTQNEELGVGSKSPMKTYLIIIFHKSHDKLTKSEIRSS